MDMIYTISIWLLPVVIAVTFHEAAHGYVARFLGDETASKLGRVSLNPLRHIDPVGTILLPGLLLLARSPISVRICQSQCRLIFGHFVIPESAWHWLRLLDQR